MRTPIAAAGLLLLFAVPCASIQAQSAFAERHTEQRTRPETVHTDSTVDGPRLRLSAQLRASQLWEPPVGGRGGAPRFLRTRFGAEVVAGPWGRAVARIQDSRGYGDPVLGADSISEVLRAHEAFLELGTGISGINARLRMGRQEIALGNERLIGRDDWSPTGRSFDAARVLLERPRAGWGATAFLGRQAGGLAFDRDRYGVPSREDLLLAGHIATQVADAYLIHEDDAPLGSYRDVDRTTAGLHLRLPESMRLRAELEWAYQLGSLVEPAYPQFGRPTDISRPIRASLLGLRFGLPDATPQLRYLGLGLDRLSGDADRNAYGAFEPLYGSSHRFYGQRDVFLERPGRTDQPGLVDAFIEMRWDVQPITTLELALHRFFAAEERGFTEERALGWELDLRMPVRTGDHSELDMGYSVYRFAAPGGQSNEPMRHWGYARLTLEL